MRLVSIHPECKKTFFGERIALYNFFECVLFCFGFGLESSSKNIRKNFLWKTIRNYFWPGVQKLHPEIKEFFLFFRPGARKCARLPIYLLLRLLHRCLLMNSVEVLHEKVFCKFWVIWSAQELKKWLDYLISCDKKGFVTFCYHEALRITLNFVLKVISLYIFKQLSNFTTGPIFVYK